MKTPYLSVLAITTLLLGTFACEKQPKDDATSAGVDTTGMKGDTSTQAMRAKALADSLEAANRNETARSGKLHNLSVTINRACPVSFTPAIYLEPKKDETRKSLMTSITADKQPIVAELRRNGVDILFRYRDKEGQPLFEIPLNANRAN